MIASFPEVRPAFQPRDRSPINFDWRPVPGIICHMHGKDAKGSIPVKVLRIDGDVAEVRSIGKGGTEFKVGVYLLKQWKKGEADQQQHKQRTTPLRVDQVETEPLYVMNKNTGMLLSRYTRNPNGHGFCLGWVDQIKGASQYATRNSAAIAVSTYRKRDPHFEHTICTKAQIESLLAIQKSLPAPVVQVEAPAPAPEPQAVVPPTMPAPVAPPLVQAIASTAQTVAVIADLVGDTLTRARTAYKAALDEEGAAYEIYMQAKAKTKHAKQCLRFAEQTCACDRKAMP